MTDDPITPPAPAQPSDPGWSVRPTNSPWAPPPPFNPPAAQTQLPPDPVGYVPYSAVPQKSRRGSKRLLGAGGVIVLVILLKVGVGVVLGTGIRVAATATIKQYHVPVAIASYSQSTDPTYQAVNNQLLQGFQLPGLQNAHSESAIYADSSGPVYAMAFGQDNAGQSTVRTNADFNTQFPGSVAGSQATSTKNGLAITCGTMPPVSGNAGYQACTWYNDNAFGMFIDYQDASVSAASQLLSQTLTTMVA